MKLLATDLDRTLLPNGKWEKDKEAISIFNSLTLNKKDLILVYVTGRSLKLTKDAIKKYNIRIPDILIGDVGTSVRFYKNNSWYKDRTWKEEVYKKSKNWNLEEIKSILKNFPELKEQEKEKLNEFKLSYYINHKKKEEILKKVNSKIKGKFDEEIIYSFDPLINKGLLDILPKSATKQTALEHVLKNLNISKKTVLYCGDSGNDILPLTSGVNAVLVKNADIETIKKVKEISKNKNIENKIFIAKGNFMGLNGNYTSGIIEGAYHFGFF